MFDSLVYEVVKGRECSSMVAAYELDLNAVNIELNEAGKVIRLQRQQNEAQEGLILGFPEQLDLNNKLHKLETDKLKKKKHRLVKLVIAQGVVIVGLILLL